MIQIRQLRDIEGIDMSTSKDERVIKENNWVRLVNKGEKKAFEAMYKSYFPQLCQFALRYASSRKVSEDIVQNVFYSIWKNRKRLEPRGTLRAYLYTSVRNQALKQLEKNKVRNGMSLDRFPDLKDQNDNPGENLEYKEFNAAVIGAIKTLPEKRRHIFLMHREDKMTYLEIADVLNISVKTVETQMSRSLKYLTEKLAHFRHR